MQIFYGWWVAAAAWLVYFLTTGSCTYGFGVVTTKLVLEEGWGETVIGLVSSGNSLLLMLACIPGSMLIRKMNHRFTIIVGTLIGGFVYGMLWLLPVSEISYILLISISGVSACLGGLLIGPSLINTWFERNRALPMAFVMSAGGVGGFVMPMIARYLSAMDIRYCWMLYFSMMMLALFLGIFVVRDAPECVNEVKDGRAWLKRHPADPVKAGKKKMEGSMSLKQCYRSHLFWSMSVQTCCMRIAWGAFLSYSMYYVIQKGATAAFAAMVLSGANMAGFLFRCMSGISDRITLPKNLVTAVCYLFIAAGNLLIVFSPSEVLWLIGAWLIGGGYGFMVVYFPLLAAEIFGSSNFVMLNGIFNTINCAGLAVGPILAFSAAAVFHGYHSSFLLAAAVMLICSGLAVQMSCRRDI